MYTCHTYQSLLHYFLLYFVVPNSSFAYAYKHHFLQNIHAQPPLYIIMSTPFSADATSLSVDSVDNAATVTGGSHITIGGSPTTGGPHTAGGSPPADGFQPAGGSPLADGFQPAEGTTPDDGFQPAEGTTPDDGIFVPILPPMPCLSHADFAMKSYPNDPGGIRIFTATVQSQKDLPRCGNPHAQDLFEHWDDKEWIETQLEEMGIIDDDENNGVRGKNQSSKVKWDTMFEELSRYKVSSAFDVNVL
jgi:hypothetical protein